MNLLKQALRHQKIIGNDEFELMLFLKHWLNRLRWEQRGDGATGPFG